MPTLSNSTEMMSVHAVMLATADSWTSSWWKLPVRNSPPLPLLKPCTWGSRNKPAREGALEREKLHLGRMTLDKIYDIVVILKQH